MRCRKKISDALSVRTYLNSVFSDFGGTLRKVLILKERIGQIGTAVPRPFHKSGQQVVAAVVGRGDPGAAPVVSHRFRVLQGLTQMGLHDGLWRGEPPLDVGQAEQA